MIQDGIYYAYAQGVNKDLGKSTFFQMITGNLDPDEGKILINGERFSTESYHLKRKFGYLPQKFRVTLGMLSNT